METIKILVIFGASGDLTSRKLIPALFGLFWDGKLNGAFYVIGVSRTRMSDQQWRDRLEPTAAEIFSSDAKGASGGGGARFRKEWGLFADHLHYFPGDIYSKGTFIHLNHFLRRWETGGESGDSDVRGERDVKSERIYYLALAPDAYKETVRHLGEAGMADETPFQKRRLMIEKPFGSDRQSAEELTCALHQVFQESQIFRIDHYLGKETVNNIFVLRFANTIFEPLWNRLFVDHIQITAGEAVTVGRRGPFYEKAQVLRDMFQNHLLQLLAVTTMEAPVRFDAHSVRDEKVKVLNAVRRVTPEKRGRFVLFGQYDGYRSENGVASDSRTPTFAVMKLFIDNGRWKDVPIYLRSGKGMGCLTTQVVIQYREPPRDLFRRDRDSSEGPEGGTGGEELKDMNGNLTDLFPNDANRLLIQIQPSEGIRLSFLTKIPGTETQVRKSELTFAFHDNIGIKRPENAYERLFLDALNDDASLFARNDEITAAWEIVDPFLDYWESGTETETGKGSPESGRGTKREFSDSMKGNSEEKPLFSYPVGAWGPAASDDWMARDGKRWFNLCPVIRNR